MKNILSKQEIETIKDFCADYLIMDYKINPDGSVDTNESVIIDSFIDRYYFKGLPFKFNIINGDFTLAETSIENLHNMPNIVNGDYNISDNHITSLEGCPRYIKGDFNCSSNNLDSLYVGDYDVIVGGDINMPIIDGLVNHIYTNYDQTENPFDLIVDEEFVKLLFKYQRHYDVWNKDKTLNVENLNELVEEIKDGLK